MSSVLSKRKVFEMLCPAEAAKKPAPSLGKCLDEVFLGGACNPTTWRKDIAIPFLEASGIPYFNPQFDEWRPELIAQEAAAKERASCLLFVFQPHLTRGLASLVEVAYFAARSHLRNNSSFYRPSRLLLVVRPSPSTLALGGPAIFHATPAEAASIKAAYQWLEGLRFSHVRFFERLEDALLHIKALYQSRQRIAMGLHSAAHSNRQSMKREQKKGADPDPYDKAQNMTGKKLLATYQYSPFHRKVTADLIFDLYCGGTAPKRVDANSKGKRGAINATATTNWVLCRQHTKRDFALSMAVQRHCSRLYFHISRQGLWIVEQMEAAFAIGSGKEVILCVEYLSDNGNVTSIAAESEQETSSGNSSGYSSLASTPDEAYQPPSTTTTVTDPSSLSSSSPVSYPLPPFRSVSCSRMGLMRTHTAGVECEKEHHTIRKDKAKEDKTTEKVISLPSTPSVVFGGNEVCGLSPIAVKDHNRSRNYLKALLEEAVERGDGRGLLLSRPVEDIKDLFSTLF